MRGFSLCANGLSVGFRCGTNLRFRVNFGFHAGFRITRLLFDPLHWRSRRAGDLMLNFILRLGKLAHGGAKATSEFGQALGATNRRSNTTRIRSPSPWKRLDTRASDGVMAGEI